MTCASERTSLHLLGHAGAPQPFTMADNKAGTKKLLGTFDVESYISIGDDYMKKMSA